MLVCVWWLKVAISCSFIFLFVVEWFSCLVHLFSRSCRGQLGNSKVSSKIIPMKSKIDTQNSHVWKEIHVPNHHFLVSMLDFGGVYSMGIRGYPNASTQHPRRNTALLLPWGSDSERMDGVHSRDGFGVDWAIFGIFVVTWLGGGFKDFLFSALLGEMVQFDLCFSNGLKPPTN